MTIALESFKRRGLIGKIEVTEGTDPTPTALANGILLYDGTSRIHKLSRGYACRDGESRVVYPRVR